jgi:hypothetical protein
MLDIYTQHNTELASNLLHVEDVLLSLVIRPVRPGRGVQQQRHVQLNKGYVQLKKPHVQLLSNMCLVRVPDPQRFGTDLIRIRGYGPPKYGSFSYLHNVASTDAKKNLYIRYVHKSLETRSVGS